MYYLKRDVNTVLRCLELAKKLNKESTYNKGVEHLKEFRLKYKEDSIIFEVTLAESAYKKGVAIPCLEQT